MIDIAPTRLLPHRAPMLLVEGIHEFDEANDRIVAAASCSTQDLFYDPKLGGVSPMASIEIMAQAIGLHSGYADLIHGVPPASMGKLLSIKQYRSYTPALPVDTPLQVVAQAILDMSPLGVFSCSLRAGNQLLAEAEITVYRED